MPAPVAIRRATETPKIKHAAQSSLIRFWSIRHRSPVPYSDYACPKKQQTMCQKGEQPFDRLMPWKLPHLCTRSLARDDAASEPRGAFSKLFRLIFRPHWSDVAVRNPTGNRT